VTAPRVSVVIPTWNRSAALRCAIASVLDQTFRDFELLVIGDGCTDDSAKVTASFGDPRVRWHDLGRRTGSQVAPNNTGIALASGEYVAYLGHDDLWHADHLAALVGAVGDGADLAFTATLVFGPPGTGVRAVSGLGLPAMEEPMRSPPPSSWIHRRDLVERLGGWRDHRELEVPHDHELFWRIRGSGAVCRAVPRLTVFKLTAAWRRDAYRTVGAPEQEELLRRLREEPHLVEEELLTAVAAAGDGKLVTADRASRAVPGAVVEQTRAFKGADVELPAEARRDRLRFELDRTLPGFEWHGVERDPRGRGFQWSGPGTSASLHLPLVNDRDLELLLELLPPLAHDLLDGLRVSVNDQPLAMVRLRDRRGLVRFRGRIPAAALARGSGFTRLQLDVPRTVRPSDLLPGSTDRRRLGVALCAVEIAPLRS
jgi:glycosyl transferase family 2